MSILPCQQNCAQNPPITSPCTISDAARVSQICAVLPDAKARLASHMCLPGL